MELTKRMKDISNQRFERLVALYPVSIHPTRRNVIWHCKCDCGNEIDVLSASLLNGHTKSCGCLQKEAAKNNGKSTFKDLTGKFFGELTVLRLAPAEVQNQFSNTIWECQCSCGNITYVTQGNLVNGHTKSCGCIKSQGEKKIIQILVKNHIKFETQKTFETCRFPNTNALARFDFYLPDYNVLIEYDGEQHFNNSSGGWNTEERLKQTQKRDMYKNQWCKNNNISLIRIPYLQLQNIDINDLLPQTSSFLMEVYKL